MANDVEVIFQVLMRPMLAPASNRRKIHKVQPYLRHENEENYYDPKVVSVGPYHHGNRKFQYVEEVKYKALLFLGSKYKNWDISTSYNEIFVVIDDIRDSYVEGSTDRYSDAELARMMLLDSCFLLNFMEDNGGSFIRQDLGLLILPLLNRDVLLLENQIPLWILKRLATSMYGESSWKELLGKFTTGMIFPDMKPIEIGRREEQCLHFLELYRNVLISECNTETVRFPSTFQKYFRCRLFKKQRRNSNLESKDFLYSVRSARDLKSKGILFKPSSLQTLGGIKFKSYYYLFGQLSLPSIHFSTGFMVRHANMIAYEMSPDTKTSYDITSYVNFLKSLVTSAEDVKELREKKILFNIVGTDEEAVKLLQEIPTGTVFSGYDVKDIGLKIQQHIGSKKILLAELYWKYLRSPWSFIGLLAATALLGLTTVQTYFTIYPRK